jgi:hypothetical protein
MNRCRGGAVAPPGWSAFMAGTVLPRALDGIDLGPRVLELGPGYGASSCRERGRAAGPFRCLHARRGSRDPARHSSLTAARGADPHRAGAGAAGQGERPAAHLPPLAPGEDRPGPALPGRLVPTRSLPVTPPAARPPVTGGRRALLADPGEFPILRMKPIDLRMPRFYR